MKARWFLPLCLLAWLLLGQPRLPGDTGELAAVARALWGREHNALDLAYRPPLPLLLAGWMPDARVGIGVVAMLGMALCVLPGARLARSFGGTGFTLAAAFYLAHPVLSHALAGDSRGLGVACLLFAVERTAARSAWAGVAVALAAACRAENLAAAVLLPLAGWRAVAAFTLAMIPQVAWASFHAGRLVLVPRGWEMAVAELWTRLPRPVLHLEYGTTSFSTPARVALQAAGGSASTLPSLSLDLGLLARALPPLLLVVATVGAWWARGRAGLALFVVGSVGVLASAMPQGKALGEGMLLPTTVVALLLADVATGRLLARLPRRYHQAMVPLAVIAGVALAALSLPERRLPPAERTPATQAARDWLAAHPELPSVAIDGSFDALTSGGRVGTDEPSWNTPTRVVLTPRDDPWLVLTWLVPGDKQATLEAAWDNGEDWAAIVRVE